MGLEGKLLKFLEQCIYNFFFPFMKLALLEILHDLSNTQLLHISKKIFSFNFDVEK